MSEFEDAANQMIRDARETQQTYATQEAAAPAGLYAPRDVPTEPWPYPPTAGRLRGGNPIPTTDGQRFGGNRIAVRCGPDDHYFACRHEQRCECGLTERLPLQLPDGL